MLEATTLVKVLAQETDAQGYTTYVFQILDEGDKRRLNNNYLMCVKWPNWDHREVLNGEEGYLHFKEVVAGVDNWYNGNTFTPYKYTNIIFNKFITRVPDDKFDFKM